jgi:arsenate reductase-like glutaredoxin family protein
MDHVRIFKELHSLACLLEDNGKFIESSQITNVMTRIAQTAPTGNPTPGNAGTGNLSKDELKKRSIEYNKKFYNEMLRLRELSQFFIKLNKNTEYTIDSRGYVIKVNDKTYQKPTIEELVKDIANDLKISIPVPVLPTENKNVDKIAENIDSAADWPDPLNDASITQEINKEYMLGYNLLAGTYYISKKSDPTDVIDKTDINELKIVFDELGKYYKNNQNKFPDRIYKINKEQSFFEDPNKIILDALKENFDTDMVSYIKKFNNHPNYKDIKRGFVQEYNRRRPDDKISENLFT